MSNLAFALFLAGVAIVSLSVTAAFFMAWDAATSRYRRRRRR